MRLVCVAGNINKSLTVFQSQALVKTLNAHNIVSSENENLHLVVRFTKRFLDDMLASIQARPWLFIENFDKNDYLLIGKQCYLILLK